MPNGSRKDERDTSMRAGAPGPGSLIGKKTPKTTPSSTSTDLSVSGAINTIKDKQYRDRKLIDEL